MTALSASPTREYLFTFKCPDAAGILARVLTSVYEHSGFIETSHHFSDPETKAFFARVVFSASLDEAGLSRLREAIARLADDLSMTWQLRPADQRPKVMIAVSKYDHCLTMLLTKWRAQALAVHIVGVVSNHEDCRSLVEWHGLPFHHFPITPATKSQQEARILAAMEAAGAELLVLARYMQILSDDLCRALGGRAINIHHSFLPSFKGAKPYHQAHDRGVKVIGATAHYVTADLDEGPIIVQEVRSIDHAYTPDDMVRVGHDTEAIALSSAVRLHCEGRVFINGVRTVVL